MSNTNLTGWFRYDRSRMNHWLWQDKPYAYGQAWDYLYAHAVHAETTLLHRGTPIHLEIGDLIMSIRRFSEGVGWNKEKANRFISLLEKEKLIKIKKDQRLDIITICDYYNQQYAGMDINIDKDIVTDIDCNIEPDIDSRIDVDAYKNNNKNNTNNLNKNNKENKTRARGDFFLFFVNNLDFQNLTVEWNRLNLKHLEVLDDECLVLLFDAFLSSLEANLSDLPNIDDVSVEQWEHAIEPHLENIPTPTAWACNYIVNGFGKYITSHHRGSNTGEWKADILFAFKPETRAKVYRSTGVL